MPLDAVGVEIVVDGQAGLLGGRVLSGGSVVRLRQASSANGYMLHVLVDGERE